MKKNNILNAIVNVATNRLAGKYNLTQYRDGGSKHTEKLKAITHKAICEQIVQFAKENPNIPLYFILSVGISKGAYKMSEFAKGYKRFDADKVKMVYRMGMAYNAHNGLERRKMSDVTIRLIMRYYERVSQDFDYFLIDLAKSKVLGKDCGSREMNYAVLCKNLNIPIKEEETKLADVA